MTDHYYTHNPNSTLLNTRSDFSLFHKKMTLKNQFLDQTIPKKTYKTFQTELLSITFELDLDLDLFRAFQTKTVHQNIRV
jgi:hypothetical protein